MTNIGGVIEAINSKVNTLESRASEATNIVNHYDLLIDEAEREEEEKGD